MSENVTPGTQSQVYVFSVIYRVRNDQDDSDHSKDVIEHVDALKPQDYIFQLERGENAGRLHYQMWLKTTDKYRVPTVYDVLNEDIPEWCQSVGVKPCSARGKMQLKNYCMKSNTRVKGPWTK